MGSDASPPANVIFNSKFSIYEMKYDELNLQKLRALPIFEVCSKLGITLYGMGKLTRRATCWYHADKHPSMHVNKKKNIYKCFVCGKGGDVIRLPIIKRAAPTLVVSAALRLNSCIRNAPGPSYVCSDRKVDRRPSVRRSCLSPNNHPSDPEHSSSNLPG